MSLTNIQLGYKDSAWFTANAARVLLIGQKVHLLQTGTYKLGDGVTALSSLAFLGGGGTGTVQSVSGVFGRITSTGGANPIIDISSDFDNLKQDKLLSGINIRTVNGSSLLGSGDLTIGGSAALTSTYVGYGVSGVLGGSSNFLFNGNKLSILNSTTDNVLVEFGNVIVTDRINGFTNRSTLVAGDVSLSNSAGQPIVSGTNLQITGTSNLYFSSPYYIFGNGGKSRFGDFTTPTAMVNIVAGTATAGTAPLKLTTGTPLTTAEDGAIEYHSSHLYFTIGSTRYQLDQQTGGFIPYTGASSTVNLNTQNFVAQTFRASNGFFDINTGATVTTGAVTAFTLTDFGNTGQTASTAIPGILIPASTRHWATGNITSQKEFEVRSKTYSFVGASVITDAFGMYVNSPTAGTNAAITNNWAAGFNGQIQVGGVNKVTITQPTTSATLTLVNGSSIITVGANALTLTTSAATNAAFPAGTGTLAFLQGVNNWAPALRSSGAAAAFTFTKPADTNQTLSTSIPGWNYVGGSRQWATGAIATQVENIWGASTYSAVAASVITTAIGNDFFSPVASTNITITNNYAARFNGQVLATDNVVISTAGKGIFVKEGTNGQSGTATLIGTGAAVVANTTITATSRIFPVGVTTAGAPGYLTITKNPGVGFTIQSSSPTDTRVVDYFIIQGN